ncbi:MAG: DUF308 domain-containing protein [Clostridiales Family XIII bacterium]|jgi:uncharacterized membrane protein HdeD (DUF308 family)|nr:DUF308 domain-containing protein [Clostridiales Family XIII bacterium]
MRIIILTAGPVLIAGGIFCLANAGQNYAALVFPVGMAMLLSGLIEIAGYLLAWREPGWTVAEGGLTVMLAAVALDNRLAAPEAVPMVFGMWLLAAGLLRLLNAAQRKGEPPAFRFTLAAFGGLSVLVGLCGFYHPLITALPLTALVGDMLLLQGISVLVFGAGLKKSGGG